MTPDPVISSVILLVLIGLSSFFSASETSLSSITKIQLRQLNNSKIKKDRFLKKILANPGRMLTTLLIGNNIVNISASSIATALTISVFGVDSVVYSTAVLTLVILVFSEMAPKTLAADEPLKVARNLSPAVCLLLILFYPLYFIFAGINLLFINILRKLSPETSQGITEDELRTMMDIGKTEGTLEENEHNLLNHAFDLTDLKLREIMTPRISIAAISIDASFIEIQEQFRKYQFSRMPVYKGSIDSIQGMIHYKDILFLLETKEEGTIHNLVRPILFVPESQSTFELLKELEHSNQNMAIIIDEHGGTAGLVTIDDALESVFGGIHDEYDIGDVEPLNRVQIIGTNHLKVPGNLKLSDLNALLKTDFASEYYETVSGFVMEQAERLPSRGEKIQFQGFSFIIEEQSNRKIYLIDISKDAG